MVQLSKRLSKAVYGLTHLRQRDDPGMCKIAYTAHFESLVQYEIKFWCFDINTSMIFNIQKRSIRIIAFMKKYDSCRSKLCELKIFTIKNVYLRHLQT